MTTTKFRLRAFALLATSLFALASLAACGGDAKVDVECSGAAEGVSCNVKHTEGSATVEACWDVNFECANGKKPSGHACKVVEPGKTEKEMIPKEKVSDWDACDKATGAKVENMKLALK